MNPTDKPQERDNYEATEAKRVECFLAHLPQGPPSKRGEIYEYQQPLLDALRQGSHKLVMAWPRKCGISTVEAASEQRRRYLERMEWHR